MAFIRNRKGHLPHIVLNEKETRGSPLPRMKNLDHKVAQNKSIIGKERRRNWEEECLAKGDPLWSSPAAVTLFAALWHSAIGIEYAFYNKNLPRR